MTPEHRSPGAQAALQLWRPWWGCERSLVSGAHLGPVVQPVTSLIG